MNHAAPRLLIDASVAVMWEITSEPNALQAREMLLDWDNDAVALCTSDQFSPEVTNALLTASRKGRLSRSAAFAALQNLLAVRLPRFRTTSTIAVRSFEIAEKYNQRAYDCIYVAVAERQKLEFWTDDRRLYNALHGQFPFVRWIGDYLRKRP